jgi:hypothetical protein
MTRVIVCLFLTCFFLFLSSFFCSKSFLGEENIHIYVSHFIPSLTPVHTRLHIDIQEIIAISYFHVPIPIPSEDHIITLVFFFFLSHYVPFPFLMGFHFSWITILIPLFSSLKKKEKCNGIGFSSSSCYGLIYIYIYPEYYNSYKFFMNREIRGFGLA